MSKQQLLNYLKIIMKLEVYKRTLEEALRHKNYQINNLKKVNSVEKPVNMTGGLMIIVLPISLVVGGLLCWGSKIGANDIWGRILLFPVKMLGIIFLGMGAVSIFAELFNWVDYKKKSKEYDEKILEEKNKQLNNKKVAEALQKDGIILKKQLVQVNDTLNKYYSLNVIYKEYRELVPITMFVQYIESGRCNTLTGHEGAYNIYHQELMAKRILDKLDEVLAETRNTQWILKNAINDSNRKIDSMCKMLNLIEQHQAVNAYYNEVNARNTQFLKDYTIYKNLLS